MTAEDLDKNLTELYNYDSSVQSWLENKWIPHKHVCIIVTWLLAL